jgi:hypothetical protein
MDEQKSSIWGGVTSWIKQPFNTQGSALNWVLFFGLFLVAVWFWSHVLMMITEDV